MKQKFFYFFVAIAFFTLPSASFFVDAGGGSSFTPLGVFTLGGAKSCAQVFDPPQPIKPNTPVARTPRNTATKTELLELGFVTEVSRYTTSQYTISQTKFFEISIKKKLEHISNYRPTPLEIEYLLGWKPFTLLSQDFESALKVMSEMGIEQVTQDVQKYLRDMNSLKISKTELALANANTHGYGSSKLGNLIFSYPQEGMVARPAYYKGLNPPNYGDVTRHERENERSLTAKELLAIEEAHLVGQRELGKNGTTQAGIDNYTIAQLLEKVQILEAAGFTPDERRTLIQVGVVGRAENSDPDMYSELYNLLQQLRRKWGSIPIDHVLHMRKHYKVPDAYDLRVIPGQFTIDSPLELFLLTKEHVQELNEWHFQHFILPHILPYLDLNKLSPQQMEYLTPEHQTKIDELQRIRKKWGDLSIERILEISETPIHYLKQMEPHNIANIIPLEFFVFSAEQVQVLNKEQIQAITPPQLVFLDLNKLSPQQMEYLTSEQQMAIDMVQKIDNKNRESLSANSITWEQFKQRNYSADNIDTNNLEADADIVGTIITGGF